ncbi:MAG: lamin tail domain-containing protein [archaeon]
MKYIIAIIMLTGLAAADHIVISEVLYDPIGTESGGEFVELYNPTNQTINISGLKLRTKSSLADATLPANATIEPSGHYLVADSGWSEGKDNTGWPDADHEETISLYTNDGVAIVNGTETIDAVGWGAGMNESLYEGTPVSLAAEGQSIERIIDTDNNSADFIIRGSPDPQNSQQASKTAVNTSSEVQTNLTMEATVTNAAPIINHIWIFPDDDITAGNQVMPVPGGTKNLTIRAEVSDPNGYADIMNVTAALLNTTTILTKQYNTNATTDVFGAVVGLEYDIPPETYTVNVTVADSNGSTGNSASGFAYMPMSALELDSSSVSFSTRPNGYSEIIGDLEAGGGPTIRNIGNTELDLKIGGTGLTSGRGTIPVTNIEYSFLDNDFSGANYLSESLADADINLSARGSRELSLRFRIPDGTPSALYVGNLFIIGVSS